MAKIAHFVLKNCTNRFRDYMRTRSWRTFVENITDTKRLSIHGQCR